MATRNYRKEYDDYQGTEAQKKRRVIRNRDRRAAIRDGKVTKGDKSKEIHHQNKRSLTKPVVRSTRANRRDQ